MMLQEYPEDIERRREQVARKNRESFWRSEYRRARRSRLLNAAAFFVLVAGMMFLVWLETR